MKSGHCRERSPRREASAASIAVCKVASEAAATAADCYCAATCLSVITVNSLRVLGVDHTDYLADLQASQAAVAEAIQTHKVDVAAQEAAREARRHSARVWRDRGEAPREEKREDEADEADQAEGGKAPRFIRRVIRHRWEHTYIYICIYICKYMELEALVHVEFASLLFFLLSLSSLCLLFGPVLLLLPPTSLVVTSADDQLQP